MQTHGAPIMTNNNGQILCSKAAWDKGTWTLIEGTLDNLVWRAKNDGTGENSFQPIGGISGMGLTIADNGCIAGYTGRCDPQSQMGAHADLPVVWSSAGANPVSPGTPHEITDEEYHYGGYAYAGRNFVNVIPTIYEEWPWPAGRSYEVSRYSAGNLTTAISCVAPSYSDGYVPGYVHGGSATSRDGTCVGRTNPGGFMLPDAGGVPWAWICNSDGSGALQAINGSNTSVPTYYPNISQGGIDFSGNITCIGTTPPTGVGSNAQERPVIKIGDSILIHDGTKWVKSKSLQDACFSYWEYWPYQKYAAISKYGTALCIKENEPAIWRNAKITKIKDICPSLSANGITSFSCYDINDKAVITINTGSDLGILLPVEVKDIKDHANTSDDVTIANWDTVRQIADNNIAWIEAHTSATDPAPRMPQLELKINGLPTTTTIQARIEVQYTRGNGARAARNQPEDRVRIPADGSFQTVTGDTWKIWEACASETFFGGEATLTYKLMTGTTETLGPQIIRFRIGGKNPDSARARTYIETLTNCNSTGSLWFAYAIAKSESKDYNGGGTRYNQFWQLPRDANDTAYRAARQTHAGRPVWGNDGGTTPGGYGMFQVTGNVADSTSNIPRQEIWNWQENARAARTILESKRTTADTWITRQKNADNANGVALPSLTVRNLTFAEGGNHTMNNAVTMKAWNGASAAPAGFTDPDGAATGFIIDPQNGGHFCYWKNSATITNKWALSRYNNPPGDIQPFNYVDRVCQEIE